MRFAAVALCGALAACAGSQQTETTTPDKAAGSKSIPPEDQAFTSYEDQAEGVRLAPAALNAPELLQVQPKGKPGLEKQRKAADKALKQRKPADLHVLVTLLWNEAQTLSQSDAAAAQALREEAAKKLRDMQTALGEQVDDVTLQQLGAIELALGNVEGATKAYDELAKRYPQHEQAPRFKAWLAYLQLRADRTADAANTISGLAADDHLVSYVKAWVEFRSRNHGEAVKSIVQAAKSWADKSNLAPVQREVSLFIARSGTPPDQAESIVASLAGNTLNARYVWLYKVHDEYVQAGHYEHASQLLGKMIELAGKDVPPDDRVAFAYRQSDYEFRLNHPGEAADRAMTAHKNLAECKDKCTAETTTAVTRRVADLARLFHTTYATSQDERHLEAARKLYQYYLAIPGIEDAETIRGYLKNLEETHKNANPALGKHDEQVMKNVVKARKEVITSCYESVLAAEAQLSGPLKLTIEVSSDGAVQGVSTEPAAGAEGMAAVGTCLTERVKTWAFPSRTVPGKTVLAFSFMLTPRP